MKTVHAMICHRDVEMAVLCLGSLQKFSLEPLMLALHDDGTLTEHDRERLNSSLPRVRIISRVEADALLNPMLERYPRCRAFRDRSAMGMKCVDIATYSDEDVIMCDTDVLFVRPFSGLFNWPGDDVDVVFLQDLQEAYSLKPWQMNGLRAVSRMNCGLMMVRRKVFHLDRMEEIVASIEDNPAFIRNTSWQWFLEQTCWSVLASDYKSMKWDPRQISVVRPDAKWRPDVVGGHFVGSVRHLLPIFKEQAEAAGMSTAEPIPMRFLPSSPYTLLSWGRVRITNKLRRHLGSLLH